MEGHATITSGGERNYHLGAPYDLEVKITKCIMCHVGSDKKLPTSGDYRPHFQQQFVRRTGNDEHHQRFGANWRRMYHW
jgi:hypothetical protein